MHEQLSNNPQEPKQEYEIYKALFDNNSTPMSMWKWMNSNNDNAFTATHLNKAACEARQLEAKDILGRSMLESNYFNDDVSEVFREVIHSQKPVTVGKLAYVHNRPERTFMVKAFPVSSDSVAAIFEDITDLEEAQKKLRKETEEKERIVNEKSSLLVSVSHELRSPLNGIIGGTELLMREPERQNEYLSTIHQCSINLLNLVNDLLDYSKADVGKLKLNEQSTVVHQVIEASLDMFSLQAMQKHIHLGYFIDTNVPYAILIDASRLQQILVNLVSNAVKCTTEGEIMIKVGIQSQNMLRFSVMDSGIGIPEDKVKSLFQEYTQLNYSDSSALGGTGLGLAISRRLVSLMCGNIWLESKLSIGTTFHFEIPLKSDTKLLPAHYEGLAHQCVLILSKNESIAIQIASHLRIWNVPVTWHNTTDSDCSDQYISQFKIVFRDYTSCTKPLHYDDVDLPKSDIVQRDAEGTHPIKVAIVDQDRLVDQGLPAGPVIRIPIKRDALIRVMLRKDTIHKSSQPATKEPWENFGQDHHLNILLVDDSQISRTIGSRMLYRMGYPNVDVAIDGLEAVAKSKQKSYDLILMDIQMPQLNGMEATRKIRQNNQRVFICALSAGENRKECLDVGMNYSVMKPITMFNLFDVIEECCFCLSL